MNLLVVDDIPFRYLRVVSSAKFGWSLTALGTLEKATPVEI
jgi:hypothetical protein